jgi:hypothetical protein
MEKNENQKNTYINYKEIAKSQSEILLIYDIYDVDIKPIDFN